MALDATDGAILRRLTDGPRRPETLAVALGEEVTAVRERLARLQDEGLVATTADPDGAYAPTVDGRRVVAAPGTGTADDRIDTSPAVERALERLGLGPDRTAALRAAYVFLAFWGDATGAEIGDALFAEHPAGYDDPAAWWDDLVSDGLASLPDVLGPDDDLRWRYAGDAEADAVEDGRHVAGPIAVGSVRHGVDHVAGSPEERTAVRAAFAALFDAGELRAGALVDAVYPDHPAGYDTAPAWWEECVRPALASLPHVTSDASGDIWRYGRRPSETA